MQSIYNPDDTRQMAQVINDLVRQFENTGSVTLTNSATSTVVSNPLVMTSTVPNLIAADANAKAEDWFIQSVGTGQFTIGHSSGMTTRKFYYVLHGV